MKKTIFLTIIAGVLTAIAILLFTTGCHNQSDDKTIKQNIEDSTTVEETTAKKTDNVVATKPPETTKATMAAKEEMGFQTIDPEEESAREQINDDWGSADIYNDYSDDQLLSENEYAEDDIYDYHPEDPDYPQKENKHHHTFNNLIDFEQEECGHFITVYECECGETRTEEGHGEDSEGNWLLEEVDNWIDHDEFGNPMGENWMFRCPICGYEECWGTD